MVKLKLVASNAQVVGKTSKGYSKRPLIVQYQGGHVGHCSTLKSAIVAATRWILSDATKKAEILDNTGATLATLEQARRTIITTVTLRGKGLLK